ncbi:FG-GAP-like repeat-containing protein [Kitasatospora sp. MAP5-34]|uniref:FG-GAP-like repeat-containing protein n=1 Tax=Kitasatospora sp. MAP5-34 TaxID=3035102 RepID=UPI00247345CA|nr:FG-GAP-like repeat-containing protein [Kitasatospora sp. MAP5-34]MDH6575725.1 endonuclease/exonuclease/phosphatase family metal-dependent hydrolase [Kitasatospora sp. MAP5-34]
MTVRLLRGTTGRIAAVGAGLLLAFSSALVPGHWGGATAQAATTPPPLKVVTFNTCGQSLCHSRYGLTLAQWTATLKSAVTSYDADVVDLQELCMGQGQSLAAALPGYTFHYLKAETLAAGQTGCQKWVYDSTPTDPQFTDTTAFGAGMLVKNTESPTFNDQVLKPADPAVEPRPLICAEATDSGQPYQTCTAHLDGGVGGLKAQGLPQAINRMQYWGGVSRPTVFAGDFNADPTDPNLGLLYSAQDGNGTFTEAEQGNRAYFSPACRQLANCRSGEMTTLNQTDQTGTVTDPARKFDYIFSSSADFTTAQADTTMLTYSGQDITYQDHLMYRATLNWNPNTQAPSAPQVFNNPATIGTGNDWANAVDRTAGDFTGSGTADMVLRYADGSVMRYPGLGDGTFGTGQQLVSRANGWYDAAGVTAGYFNGDGHNDHKADLLVRWNNGRVYLYPNDGTGKLGGSVPLLPPGSWPSTLDTTSSLKALDVTTGNVFGGPNSDVVIRWSDGSITASQVSRAADGSYSVGTPSTLERPGFAMPNTVVDLTTGDFNGDGIADLLLRGADGSITFYLGIPGGIYQSQGTQVTDGRNWSGFAHQSTFSWKAVEDITAGDFNRDGKDDVVLHWMSQYDDKAPGAGQTEFLPSTPGTAPVLFGAPSVLKSASPGVWTNTADVLAADVNKDGKTDLITRQSPGATVLKYGSGNGQFGSGQELGGPPQNIGGVDHHAFDWASTLTVGNFASDGSLGLLARDKTSGSAGIYPISTQPLAAPAGVPGLSSSNWQNALDVVAGHFFGGPLSDLVIRYGDGSVVLYQNTGGAFGNPVTVRSAGGWSDARTITAGDFNGDGKDDLLVRWNAGSAFLYPGTGNPLDPNAHGFGPSIPVKAAGDLSDVMDVAQGTIYGPAQGAKMFYHWADGSLLVDGNGTANLANPAPATVSGPDARFTLRSSDNRGRVASFEYTLDGAGAPVSLDAWHNSLDIQLHGLTAGTHTLSVVAVDPSGNRSAATSYGFTDS